MDQSLPSPPSRIEQALAKQSVLVAKRSTTHGEVLCELGTKLTIQSLVVSYRCDNQEQFLFGIRFQQIDYECLSASAGCLIDYEASEDVLLGIKQVIESTTSTDTQRLACDDYELEYQTSSQLIVGCSRGTSGEWQAFISIPPGSLFPIRVDQLREVFFAIKSARAHLQKAGAVG